MTVKFFRAEISQGDRELASGPPSSVISVGSIFTKQRHCRLCRPGDL